MHALKHMLDKNVKLFIRYNVNYDLFCQVNETNLHKQIIA